MPAGPWSRAPGVAPTCRSAALAKAPAKGKQRDAAGLEERGLLAEQLRPWTPPEDGACPKPGGQVHSRCLASHRPGV